MRNIIEHPLVRSIIICLLSLLLVGVASAEYVDLTKGGIQKAVSPCEIEQKVYVCFLVELQEKMYLIAHDEKGESILWLVDEKSNLKKIWSRPKGVSI